MRYVTVVTVIVLLVVVTAYCQTPAGLAGEDQVVASLRRVVLNRDSGMGRPHDWISNDPRLRAAAAARLPLQEGARSWRPESAATTQ